MIFKIKTLEYSINGSNVGFDPTLPKIFVVSRSKYIRRLADENKTIFDLYKLGGLDKYMVRNLIKEIEEFYGYLQSINTKTEKIKHG